MPFIAPAREGDLVAVDRICAFLGPSLLKAIRALSGPDNPDVEVKLLKRGNIRYLLARSKPRRSKERAMRRRQRRALAEGLKKLHGRVAQGRLKQRDKVVEAVGRLKERYPRVARYHALTFDVKTRQLENRPLEEKRKVAASLDGSYLLRTDRQDLSADEAWRIYLSLTTLFRKELPELNGGCICLHR